MYRLGTTRQPEDTSESEYYSKFKTVIEVCEARGIKFSLMCTANVDMDIKELSGSGDLTKNGTFKDGTYFLLYQAERELVNARAEEICLVTRFLSLSSNKLHSQSKQELKNDLIKGVIRKPRKKCLIYISAP